MFSQITIVGAGRIGTLFSISIVRDPYSFSPLASLVAFVLSLCQF